MELQLQWDSDNRLILACSGELGWDAMEALTRQAGDALKGHDQPQVLLDLEAVDFVTSSGIGTLLHVRKLVHDLGGRLVIVRAAPVIGKLFATVGLDRHIPLLATFDEARRFLERAGYAATVSS